MQKKRKLDLFFSLKNKNNFKEESLELSIFKRYLTKQDYKFLKKNSTFQKNKYYLVTIMLLIASSS